jgi:hypothetical protein
MEQEDRYIRFDWAIKRLLRNKAIRQKLWGAGRVPHCFAE